MSNSKPKNAFDVFVNYRREDARADAGRLYDRLAAHFGHDHVFMDVDDIEPGENFTEILEKTLDHCSVVIAVIGPNWLDCTDANGQRRLDKHDDFILMELGQALARKILLIPVLVGGAVMPTAGALPSTIRALAQQQAFEISDSRFHTDVDTLINDLETADHGLRRRRGVSKFMRFAIASILAGIAALWVFSGLLPTLKDHETAKAARPHIDIADRFAADGNYVQAVDELNKALEFRPGDGAILRKIVKAKREHLLFSAFGHPDTTLHVGIRPDINRFDPTGADNVDDALNSVYQLKALAPSMEKDADILLDEALILKSSGVRAAKAIPLLAQAAELAPNNARVLAELGLLDSIVAEHPEAIEFIRRAIAIEPNEARHHFYLAVALSESRLCHYPGYEYDGTDDGEACAEAIKSYERASRLATGTDLWTRQIQRVSITNALAIFHRYARKEKDILTAKLAMPVVTRIESLEYLIGIEDRPDANGADDYPRYWLALLYESNGEVEKAEQTIFALMNDAQSRPRVWLELYLRLLEKTASNPTRLEQVRSMLENLESDN